MEIIEAIRTRRSIRSYKPEPIPREVLEEIVEACQWAGSPGNMQPWEFAILGGKVMEEFRKLLYEKRVARAPAELEFNPPLEVPEAYDKRRSEHREVENNYVYPPGTQNVEEQRHAHFLSGARLLNAPSVIIVYKTAFNRSSDSVRYTKLPVLCTDFFYSLRCDSCQLSEPYNLEYLFKLIVAINSRNVKPFTQTNSG